MTLERHADFKTTDLLDGNEDDDAIQVAAPIFHDYGGRHVFCGPIATVSVHDDNVLVRKTLEAAEGAVLVVDGQASTRCALVGDMVAQLACDKGWQGIVVNGCIRDAAEIRNIDIGLKALHTSPRRSLKQGKGDVNVQVAFAGVVFTPGQFLYADEDGIILSPRALK